MSLRTVVRNRTAQVQRQDLEDALTLCRSVRRSDPGKLLETACYAHEKAELEGFDDIVIQALLLCAEATHRLGRHDTTRSYLQRVETLISASGSLSDKLALQNSWGLHYLEIGEYLPAYDYFCRTLQLSSGTENLHAKSTALNSLGIVFTRAGDHATALRFYFDGLGIAEEKNYDVIPSLLTNIGTAYASLGDSSKALEYYHRSLTLRTTLNDTVGIGITLKNIAHVHRLEKNFGQAIEHFERSLEIWRGVGNDKKEANILSNIAMAYAESGDLGRALSIIRKSVQRAQRTKNTLEYAYAVSKLGWICQLRKEYDRSLAALQKSLRLFRKLGMRDYEFILHLNLAEVYQAQGNYQKGMEHQGQYIAIREEVMGVKAQRSVAEMEVRRALLEAEREKERLRAQAEEARKEVELRTKELNTMTLDLTQRNEMLKKIRDDILPLLHAGDEKTRKSASLIVRQIKEATEGEERNLFQAQFEGMYQEFVRQLRAICPDLTPTEIRICVLIKLNLSTKQMAEMLFTSPFTIKTHRTHIRRKLGLKGSENLSSLLFAL